MKFTLTETHLRRVIEALNEHDDCDINHIIAYNLEFQLEAQKELAGIEIFGWMNLEGGNRVAFIDRLWEDIEAGEVVKLDGETYIVVSLEWNVTPYHGLMVRRVENDIHSI